VLHHEEGQQITWRAVQTPYQWEDIAVE